MWNEEMQRRPRGTVRAWGTLVASLMFAIASASVASASSMASRRASESILGDSADVAATVRAFHAALARGDSAAALALLASDARIVEAGGVETLAEYRSHHLPADIEFARAVPNTPGALHVTIQGENAWVVSTSDAKGEFRGRAVDSTSAELMVLTRTSVGWRIRAIHWSSRRRTPRP